MKKSFSNDYRKIKDDSYMLEVYDNIQKDNEELVPYHWHREPEVMFCYEGAVDISCNGETFQLKKGDILFINSSQIHSVHIYPYTETLTFVFALDSLISRRMDECDIKYILPLKNMETIIVSSVISEQEYSEKHRLFTRDSQKYHRFGYDSTVRVSVGAKSLFI